MLKLKAKYPISQIAENIATAKYESSIYRFLSKSSWDDELLIEVA
ncbi:MAG: hypothetical protein QJR05_08055 [Thermoanaerobacterium sp.]|nr:hypothetical protein [Thermoanaerobacterium sp.]